MGLDRVDPDADPDAVDVPFALYDGSQFVLNQSDWTMLTMLRMGLRYGTAPLRFNGVPRAFFSKFEAVYDLQVRHMTSVNVLASTDPGRSMGPVQTSILALGPSVGFKVSSDIKAH